ncbi:LysR family transcriptional regulator [Roseateles depolymerans]|uniref:Transcriptional regulator, LysR family n=1 Tax=Roseateles depolymerans TaxID=76731 RepID=A0A0U3MJQ4_9BURK|nr:LysR family transcriptional regulator [Roseateles depolymerans]ALV04570.1 Transcriptional regulator, LysR family [Roseateles depolymerans]REG14102.1 LysR family transcriptional regulator [Roseateles depolymerans]
MSSLNYRHLHYFWVVAKEGGFARAADRLGMAVQTISAQVRELERALGHQLLKPEGRGLVLTEAGQAAFSRAEEIFQIGQLVPHEVHEAATQRVQRLSVGLSDGLSKLAAHALLAPVLDTPNLRLICHEGEVDQLLGELALHHLDLVLTDQPAPVNPTLRITSQLLASTPVDWWGPADLVARAQRSPGRPFPYCLEELPVLLPTRHASLRASIERWFEQHHIRPQVVGEFEDSALMSVFAARGLGVFPVSRLGGDDLALMSGLHLLGQSDVVEDLHGIYSRRGQNHPLVAKLLASRRQGRAETESSEISDASALSSVLQGN